MTKQEILQIAMEQSAADIGCKADDFRKSENIAVPFVPDGKKHTIGAEMSITHE